MPVGLLLILRLTTFGQEIPEFATEVQDVRVDTSVTRNQRPLRGLHAEDFVLLEEGQARPILATTTDEVPLDIVVVYPPVPAEVEKDPISKELAAYVSTRLMNGIANALKPMRPGDRVAFVRYDMEPHIDLPFTSDRSTIAAAVLRVGATHGETLFIAESLAMEYAVRLLEDVDLGDPTVRTNRRRLIVKMTGWLGGGPFFADGPIIRRLWETNTILSNVEVAPGKGGRPAPVFRARRLEPERALFRVFNPAHIAQATGGDAYLVLDPQNPQDLLTPMRQRYTLWFAQPPGVEPGQNRRISVELSEDAQRRYPDAEVQAREGYVSR